MIRQCGDGCNEARSEKHVTVWLLAQSNEIEITWNTDESYRLDVITSGVYNTTLSSLLLLLILFIYCFSIALKRN